MFLVVTNNNCYSEEPDDNRIIYEESFRILRHANVLYASDNEQSTAFFNLFENENAIKIFIELLRESETGVGKFYALLGLYAHDKDIYNEIIASVDLSIVIGEQFKRSHHLRFSSRLSELIITIENGMWMDNLNSDRRNLLLAN
jgi:hypothetical protein